MIKMSPVNARFLGEISPEKYNRLEVFYSLFDDNVPKGGKGGGSFARQMEAKIGPVIDEWEKGLKQRMQQSLGFVALSRAPEAMFAEPENEVRYTVMLKAIQHFIHKAGETVESNGRTQLDNLTSGLNLQQSAREISEDFIPSIARKLLSHYEEEGITVSRKRVQQR